MPLLAVHHQADAALARDDGFQRQPPGLAETVRKRGRQVDRERHAVPRQHRIGRRDDILVAAVEGQARRTAWPSASVTARRHTSSIETISNFQRFSARIVRSRNCGVISCAAKRLKAAGVARPHAFEPQNDAGAADAPPPQPNSRWKPGQLQPGLVSKIRFPDDNVRVPRCGRPAPPRPHCPYSLLTFLCKGRPKPKNVNNLLHPGFAMTMAAAIENRTAACAGIGRDQPHRRRRYSSAISTAAETIWRGLEDAKQFSTPYQRFDFLSAWQRQVGAREGHRPFIVIAYDAERRPLLLLPLALSHEHGVRTAQLHGRQARHLQHGAVGPGFRRGRHAADLDAPDIGDPRSAPRPTSWRWASSR